MIRRSIPLTLAMLCLAALSGLAQSSAPCSEPEQKQFDFWLGSWNLTWPGQKEGEIAHGTNTIARTLGGCVVQESFSGGDAPLRGMSVSIYQPREKVWKQTWVDNQGSYLDFTGGMQHGEMVLSRAAITPAGKHILQRMVFKNITAGAFDWSWEKSEDNGAHWQVQWPIHYARKK